LGVVRLVRRDLIVGFRTLASAAVSLILTILLYVYVAGVAYGNIIGYVRVEGVRATYVEFLAPGLMVVAAVESSFITGSVFWIDRRLGMLHQLLAGPFTRTQYVLSKTAAAIILSLTYSAFVAAAVLTLNPSPAYAAGLAEALTVIPAISVTFSSIGLIVATKVRTPETYNIMLNIALLPLFFLTTAYYPQTALPPIIKYASQINPLTYAIETIRTLTLTQTTPTPQNIAILTTLATTTLTTALLKFKKMEITD